MLAYSGFMAVSTYQTAVIDAEYEHMARYIVAGLFWVYICMLFTIKGCLIY
jgi:hypothetical protein